jgi:RHS repeat-associated protein
VDEINPGIITAPVINDANQLSEVRHSGNNTLVEKYWYDGNDRRIKKQNSAGEFTYYVNQFYEIDNGTATSYFFRDDERIAKHTAEGMEWYLSDHLGSTTLLVNESGLEVERTEYFPYGQVQSGGLEKYGFTGQENDIDTGLMYYGARYYSPEYRIFIQPDTLLPDPYNPQALNRYAYALNNPVKYTDPSGHIPQVAAALVGAGLVLLTAWSYYDLVQTAIAWNKRDPDVSTKKLMVNIALTLPVSGGGAAKLALKLDKQRKLMNAAKEGVKAEGVIGGLKVYRKGLSVSAADLALYASTDGAFFAVSRGINYLDTTVDATVEENTIGGTRLGDALNWGSSTKDSISTSASNSKDSISITVSKATNSISTTVSKATNSISTYISKTKDTVIKSVKNLLRR